MSHSHFRHESHLLTDLIRQYTAGEDEHYDSIIHSIVALNVAITKNVSDAITELAKKRSDNELTEFLKSILAIEAQETVPEIKRLLRFESYAMQYVKQISRIDRCIIYKSDFPKQVGLMIQVVNTSILSSTDPVIKMRAYMVLGRIYLALCSAPLLFECEEQARDNFRKAYLEVLQHQLPLTPANQAFLRTIYLFAIGMIEARDDFSRTWCRVPQLLKCFDGLANAAKLGSSEGIDYLVAFKKSSLPLGAKIYAYYLLAEVSTKHHVREVKEYESFIEGLKDLYALRRPQNITKAIEIFDQYLNVNETIRHYAMFYMLDAFLEYSTLKQSESSIHHISLLLKNLYHYYLNLPYFYRKDLYSILFALADRFQHSPFGNDIIDYILKFYLKEYDNRKSNSTFVNNIAAQFLDKKFSFELCDKTLLDGFFQTRPEVTAKAVLFYSEHLDNINSVLYAANLVDVLIQDEVTPEIQQYYKQIINRCFGVFHHCKLNHIEYLPILYAFAKNYIFPEHSLASAEQIELCISELEVAYQDDDFLNTYKTSYTVKKAAKEESSEEKLGDVVKRLARDQTLRPYVVKFNFISAVFLDDEMDCRYAFAEFRKHMLNPSIPELVQAFAKQELLQLQKKVIFYIAAPHFVNEERRAKAIARLEKLLQTEFEYESIRELAKRALKSIARPVRQSAELLEEKTTSVAETELTPIRNLMFKPVSLSSSASVSSFEVDSKEKNPTTLRQ